ncbi:MAG: cardiolipin synthase B [Gemmatimonadetes bacterium]|nr:cardiolipin synthase B [Gemmatimonadota bacterium]
MPSPVSGSRDPAVHPMQFRHPEGDEAKHRFPWMELARATGSETICGNEIRLQFEGPVTFSAWLDSIRSAERFVYFENYLVRDDPVGREFRSALIEKAREGVPVYVLYDWMGCWATPRNFWKPLREAGVQVTAFNPPRVALGNPFGALQRDHRKLVVVDGKVAHLGGLCVGHEWAGTESEAPWRDTGVEIRGPAAHAAAVAFEAVWAHVSEPVSLAAHLEPPVEADGTPVWLIEGEPGRTRVYRTLHLVASKARRSIWITDAYFVAPKSISEALASAAQHGVDVRILVPAHNNWPIVGSMSRGGYRYLLESGVRIFEWQGPMMHAKTSVVDGVWSRIGSSNLNSASLLGNWELDVGVLDEGMGRQLEGLFLADLASSVEIVLPGGPVIGGRTVSTALGMSTEPLDPEDPLPVRLERNIRRIGSSPGRLTMASVVRASEILGDALAGDRMLGREDRTVLGTLSIAVLVLALLAALAPTAVGYVLAALAGWIGVTTGVRAYVQSHRARTQERAALRNTIESGKEEP